MGKKKPYGSNVTTAVLKLLIERHIADKDSESWGHEVAEATGFMTATVYPTLRRLERANWVLARDEGCIDVLTHGSQPPRTYFRINPGHIGSIRQEIAQASMAVPRSLRRLWQKLAKHNNA